MMAGLLWYRSYMDSLANTSGYYPDIHAGHADRLTELTLEEPYLVRDTPAGYNQLELMKLVGGSLAWNQLISPPLRSTYTEAGVTVTRDSTNATYVTLNGTATANSKVILTGALSYTATHIWLCSVSDSLPQGSIITMGGAPTTNAGASKVLFRYSSTVNTVLQINFNAGTTFDNLKLYPCVTDLTKMFSSDVSIADYVYALEQNEAGAGVKWLKAYSFFTEYYYAYSSPTLEHVKTTAHITKDADDDVLGIYPLDSGLVLRGVLKLDNGDLIYDGDTYDPDGTVTRYFDIRAYQAGDESLADAITDGTDTVYKLGAPTTESADPYTAEQDIEEGGTEEFVTGNNVPVGNVSVYRRA